MSFIPAALAPRSILVATDFSEFSEAPLHYGLAIARYYSSKFCLAHVVSSFGLKIAGPSAIAGCVQAVTRDFDDIKVSLTARGALNGIDHKFVVRQGEIWPELSEIVREESADLLVIGTHGRRGISKLFFGSVAEQVLRESDCPVLAFGPHSERGLWVGDSQKHTLLLATDLEDESPNGLPHAIRLANDFAAKLVLLSRVPSIEFAPVGRQMHCEPQLLRADAGTMRQHRLAELGKGTLLDVKPDVRAESYQKKPLSEWILDTAEQSQADIIIMGGSGSSDTGVNSHCSAAYEVACYSSCPVLMVNTQSGQENVWPITDKTKLALSNSDLIRIRGLGVSW